MKIWKRNAVVSVIVLFVCVALYLSWSYGRQGDDETPYFDPVAGAGEETLGDLRDLLPGSNREENEEEGAEESERDSAAYFEEARLSRRLSRDTALSILTEAAGRETTSQDIRDNASEEIARMANNALVESNIEKLIMAKGFEDCVVIIGADGISIVVKEPEGGMTSGDAAIITDIVLNESTHTVADIKIVHVEA